MHVITQPGIERQIRTHTPLVLNKHAKVRIRLNLVWNSKRLLVIDVIPTQEIIERAEGVNTLRRAGKENVDAVVKKPTAEFK